jgi:prepilin peptidase CpaA
MAVLQDIGSYKIRNITSVIGLAAGLVLNLILDGPKGLLLSIFAAGIPFVLLITFFALRMLGAGDIKLFCAIGAVMGIRFILMTMIFSFLSGGIIAIILIIIRGNCSDRLRHLAEYIKACFLTRSFQPYTDFNNKNDGSKFHFSIAIAVGCIITAFILTYNIY